MGFNFGGSSNRGSLGFGGTSSSNQVIPSISSQPINPQPITLTQQVIPPQNNYNIMPNVSSNINPMTSGVNMINPSNNNLNTSGHMLTNPNHLTNTHINNQVNTSKSELDNSLNDFNMSHIPKKESINNNDYNLVKNNMNEKFNNIYTNSIQENQFLQKTLEDDTNLLNDLVNDMERINKNIVSMNEKNKMLREQILEVRKKINQEKDNIVKATMTLNQKSNELMQTTDDYMKVNKEYSDLITSNRGGQLANPNPYIAPTSSRSSNNITSTIHPVNQNNSNSNSTSSPYNPPMNNPMATVPPLNTNYAFNNSSFNPPSFSNNQQVNNDLKQFNSSGSNNTPLKGNDNMNKSFDHPELKVYVHESNTGIQYPGLESVTKLNSKDHAFNFDNDISPSTGRGNEGSTNYFNNQASSSNNLPTYPTNTNDAFDFGFPEVKVDPFKDFAQSSKGEDIFKQTSNKFDKDPDWDF
jgi:hypothetical protein